MVHRWTGPVALLLILSLGSAAAPPPAHAQAPPTPLWARWFEALNAGDLTALRALMTTDVAADPDAAAVPVARCAGGCVGMDAIEAGIAGMVADGYWGEIDLTSVLVVDGLVSFDVAEISAIPPFYPVTTTTRWTMALDGELIAPACEGVCLRSPTARAAPITVQTLPVAGTSTIPAAAPPPISAPALRLPGATSPPARAAPSEALGPTPAPWVLGGLLAGLLIMAGSIVGSAAIDGWRAARNRDT